MKLGLEQVTQEKVDELEAHIDDIDFAYEAEEEKKLRHDVMEHVNTYGKCCPKDCLLYTSLSGTKTHSFMYRN